MKKVVPALGFSYREIPCDPDGWIDASKYLPADFDLCRLMVEGKKRHMTGWVVEGNWFGRRIDSKDKVLFWKRIKE